MTSENISDRAHSKKPAADCVPKSVFVAVIIDLCALFMLLYSVNLSAYVAKIVIRIRFSYAVFLV